MRQDESVVVGLDDPERFFLDAALLEWGGPARATDELARAMGFTDRDGLRAGTTRLRALIRAGGSLSRADWERVLAAAEIVFISDVFGSGLDWSITSGISDEDALRTLRGIQRKMPRWRSSQQFTLDHGNVRLRDQERPR